MTESEEGKNAQRKERDDHESPFVGEKNLRQVQNHPPQRQSAGDLPDQSQAQATARINLQGAWRMAHGAWSMEHSVNNPLPLAPCPLPLALALA
jgi:hypothetical protein